MADMDILIISLFANLPRLPLLKQPTQLTSTIETWPFILFQSCITWRQHFNWDLRIKLFLVSWSCMLMEWSGVASAGLSGLSLLVSIPKTTDRPCGKQSCAISHS